MADMNSRDFLAEIEQITGSLRRDIEAKERNIDPSPAAIKQRRKRVLGGDFEFFVYTYFPTTCGLTTIKQRLSLKAISAELVPAASQA